MFEFDGGWIGQFCDVLFVDYFVLDVVVVLVVYEDFDVDVYVVCGFQQYDLWIGEMCVCMVCFFWIDDLCVCVVFVEQLVQYVEFVDQCVGDCYVGCVVFVD